MVNRMSNDISNTQYNKTIKRENVDVETSVETVATIAIQTEQNILTKENLVEEYLPVEKAKKMTESLNQLLETTNTKLRYEFHEKLERYYVTLVDSETDQVVREIPNKKLMDMYAAMLEFTGIFVDKKI